MKIYVVLLGLLLWALCPERSLAQTPDLAGDFMSADCNSLKGTALDNNNLNTIVRVNFFENSTLIGTVLADRALPAVLGNSHAFEFPTPGSLKDGQLHTISARMDPVGTDMADSPRTIGPCVTTGFTIPNPKITTFEISKSASRASTQLNGFELIGIDATTDPSLNLRVEIDHPDRVQFYRLGEIACPESVSDRPEDRMKSLPWQPYSQGMSFSFRLNTAVAQPYGTRCVFMEVNRTQNESSASAAKGDSIVLTPAHLKTFALTGAELTSFLDRAKNVGYKFTLTDHSFTGPNPCPRGTVPNFKLLKPASGSAADLFETTAAKLFDRNEGRLNPFWKMTGITIPGGTGGTVTISGPPSGRVDDPFRTVGIKGGFTVDPGGGGLNHDTAGSVTCAASETIPRPFDTGKITSITLEGPDDKQPQDAFFDLNRPTFQLKPIRTIPRP